MGQTKFHFVLNQCCEYFTGNNSKISLFWLAKKFVQSSISHNEKLSVCKLVQLQLLMNLDNKLFISSICCQCRSVKLFRYSDFSKQTHFLN